jgi:hypothetical protein
MRSDERLLAGLVPANGSTAKYKLCRNEAIYRDRHVRERFGERILAAGCLVFDEFYRDGLGLNAPQNVDYKSVNHDSHAEPDYKM